MIDIQGELLAIETEWHSKYISIADLLHYLKNGNESIDYKDVATVLLKKLSDLNLEFIDWEIYPEAILEENPSLYITETYGICTYRRSDGNTAISLVRQRANLFFDFLTYIKNSRGNLDNLKISLDEFDFEQVKAEDVFVEVKKIEKELNITISQDREPYDGIMGKLQDISKAARKKREFEALTEENKQLKSKIEELSKNSNSLSQTNRIVELEQQLEELKQAQATQPPITDEDINELTYKPDVLLKFIEEIINPELLEEDGKLPTYSRLYTKLSHKYPKKRVTTKNTMKKYLSQ